MNKESPGQSLIEVIIALAVAGLLAVGLVKVGTTAVKSSRFSKEQTQMTNLAQEKIAAIINYKNKDPQNFWTVSYYPAGFDNPDYQSDKGCCLLTTITPVSLPTETPDFANSRMVQINVKIFWEKKAGLGTQCNSLDFSHSLNFDTYVTN